MKSLRLLACLFCGMLSASAAEKSYSIAVIPKGTTHEFWKSINAGAFKARDELAAQGIKVDVIWKGPLKEDDRDQQIQTIENFTTRRVSGIVLAPLDSQAMVRPVNNAIRAKVPVVIFDSGLKSDNYVSFVATDNYKGGVLAGQHMGKLLGGKGNVILLRYAVGSASTEEREAGFVDTLKKEFPQIKLISSDQYAGTTPQKSLDNATQLLTKFKDDVNGIFAVCEPNAAGVLKALEEKGLAGKVKFVAFDPNKDLIQAMSENKVHGIVLQDPVTMGYEAVKRLAAHLRGEKVEKRIGTGEYVATPKNMTTPEMDKLLKPEQFE